MCHFKAELLTASMGFTMFAFPFVTSSVPESGYSLRLGPRVNHSHSQATVDMPQHTALGCKGYMACYIVLHCWASLTHSTFLWALLVLQNRKSCFSIPLLLLSPLRDFSLSVCVCRNILQNLTYRVVWKINVNVWKGKYLYRFRTTVTMCHPINHLISLLLVFLASGSALF